MQTSRRRRWKIMLTLFFVCFPPESCRLSFVEGVELIETEENCAFSAVFADPLIKIPRKCSERSFHAPQQHSGMIRYERDEVRISWSLKFSDDELLKILHVVVQVETFFREMFSTWTNVWECKMFKLSMWNGERWLFETPQHIIRKLCRKKRNEKHKLYSKSREEFSYNNSNFSLFFSFIRSIFWRDKMLLPFLVFSSLAHSVCYNFSSVCWMVKVKSKSSRRKENRFLLCFSASSLLLHLNIFCLFCTQVLHHISILHTPLRLWVPGGIETLSVTSEEKREAY